MLLNFYNLLFKLVREVASINTWRFAKILQSFMKILSVLRLLTRIMMDWRQAFFECPEDFNFDIYSKYTT